MHILTFPLMFFLTTNASIDFIMDSYTVPFPSNSSLKPLIVLCSSVCCFLSTLSSLPEHFRQLLHCCSFPNHFLFNHCPPLPLSHLSTYISSHVTEPFKITTTFSSALPAWPFVISSLPTPTSLAATVSCHSPKLQTFPKCMIPCYKTAFHMLCWTLNYLQERCICKKHSLWFPNILFFHLT